MEEVGGVEERVGEWEEGEEKEKGSSQSHGWLGGDRKGIPLSRVLVNLGEEGRRISC